MAKIKNLKTKKTKKPNPFDFGVDVEQKLADTLVEQFAHLDDGEIEDAFVGAFSALSYRMSHLFKKEFLFKILADESALVDAEENAAEGKPYVCPDCQEIHGSPISDEERSKMN